VTLKERRATEIIPDNHHYMQSLAQSSTQYRQRDATVATEDRYERRKKKSQCPVRVSSLSEEHGGPIRIYTTLMRLS